MFVMEYKSSMEPRILSLQMFSSVSHPVSYFLWIKYYHWSGICHSWTKKSTHSGWEPHRIPSSMCPIAAAIQYLRLCTIKCRQLKCWSNLKLNISLDAVSTREQLNYIDCTVLQWTGQTKDNSCLWGTDIRSHEEIISTRGSKSCL